MWVWSLGWEDALEEGLATHSSILAWKIPWTEEPGRLQSMGLQSRTPLKWLSTHAHKEIINLIRKPPSELGHWLGISSSFEHFLQLDEPLKRFFLTQGPWFPFSMSTSFRTFILVNSFSAPLRCKPFSKPLASFCNLGLSFSRTWETFSWNATAKKTAPLAPSLCGR